MNQENIGKFLRELRKEKGLTQEQAAEKLNVSNRSISRWETARTMPDFDLLLELGRMSEVSIEELLEGRRTEDHEVSMDRTLRQIAEYNNTKRDRLLHRQLILACIGVLAWIVFLGLELLGMADSGWSEAVASAAAGIAFGMSMVMVLYTIYHLNLDREKNSHRS